MARYQVILVYDGTGFNGFQRQAKARTVQDVVETALRRLGWRGKTLLAAGRTDRGVHASGQVLAFDLAWRHSEEALLRALNSHLPFDVAARQVKAVAADFHPRYDAVSRRYCYRLFCCPVRDPLRERYAWRVWPLPDFEMLSQAAALLPGRRDFGAFGSPPKAESNTVRTVFQADWEATGDRDENSLLIFGITGDAFLYHMVRRLVSFQVAIGQGIQSLEALEHYLQGQSAGRVQGLAPPHGLVLAEVRYPEANRAASIEPDNNCAGES